MDGASRCHIIYKYRCLTPSFPVFNPFISLFCLSAVAKTLSTVLNEWRAMCCLPLLFVERFWYFLHLVQCWPKFSCVPLFVEVQPLYSLFLQVLCFFFIMKELSAQKHNSHLTRVKRQFILFFLEYNVLHSVLHNVSGHGLKIQTQFILNNAFRHGNSNRTEKVINQSTFQINCEKC